MYSYEYMTKITELLQTVHDENADKIRIVVDKFVETIKNDHIIHVFGTGHSHMVGIELFARAGGLGNVNAILDPDTITSNGAQRACALEKLPGLADVIYNNYKIRKGDIMIITSNSGRNAVPIEMAMRCQKEGIYVVVLTNLNQSKNSTSRHPSGKKLYEFADVVLDNCVPTGDALVNIDGIKTGPATSIVTMFLVDTIATEAIKVCKEKGIPVPVFQSQNVDGFNNDAIYEKYDGIIKHY